MISRQLDQGRMSRQLVEVFAHLAECAVCRQALDELRGRKMHVSDTIGWAPAHLEFEQLAGYVANQLEEVEREIAANHLAVCDFCANEVRELSSFQHDLVRAVTVRPHPKRHWRERLGQGWAWVTSKEVWAPTLAFSALLLLTAVGSWWWNQQPMKTVVQQKHDPEASSISSAERVGSAAQVLPSVTPAADMLALNDNGQTIALGKDGKLVTELELSQVYQETLATALSQQRLVLLPTLKSLTQSSRTLKSSESSTAQFSVVTPVGIVLKNDRPLFRWHPVKGATNYVVAIFDEDFNPIQSSNQNADRLTQTQWRAVQALPCGRVLLWQVTAQVGEQQITAPAAPAPEARFQILLPNQAAEIQRAQRNFPKSHFLLGTLYAQAGLVEDAVREFQALQAENPQSPLVKKFLQQLRQAR